MTPVERMIEKTLVLICTLALIAGVAIEKILIPVPEFIPEPIIKSPPEPIKNSGKMATYLKYLHYLESDYLPVSDVMDFYTIHRLAKNKKLSDGGKLKEV